MNRLIKIAWLLCIFTHTHKAMHTFIYSLRNTELPELDISLGLKIVQEVPHSIQLDFGEGIISISKFEYLNKMKVYEHAGKSFIVCTKSVSRESAFDCLMKHAIKKIDARIEHLNSLKSKYQKELEAA